MRRINGDVVCNHLSMRSKLPFLNLQGKPDDFPGFSIPGFGEGTKAAPLLELEQRLCYIVLEMFQLHFPFQIKFTTPFVPWGPRGMHI
jgi:hypothetical protein